MEKLAIYALSFFSGSTLIYFLARYIYNRINKSGYEAGKQETFNEQKSGSLSINEKIQDHLNDGVDDGIERTERRLHSEKNN